MLLNDKAFTLTEMLVVLLSISFLITIFAIPLNTNFQKLALANSTKQIRAHLDYAKMNAMNKQEKIEIIFSENGYQINQKEKVKKYKFNQCINLTTNYNSGISYNKNGSVNRAGSIKLQCGKFQKELVIGIGSGRHGEK